MEEEIDFILESAKEAMSNSVSHLEKELRKIRAGKASPAMVEGVMVDYYGAMSPLNQVANVGTLDGRTISIQPWEKKMAEPIERAIINANLGLNPQNNGEIILINIPPLTEERRMSLVKQAKTEGEDAKIGIRNARKEANDEIKKLTKEGLAEDTAKNLEDEVQSLTDNFIKQVDDHLTAKEKDIMTV